MRIRRRSSGLRPGPRRRRPDVSAGGLRLDVASDPVAGDVAARSPRHDLSLEVGDVDIAAARVNVDVEGLGRVMTNRTFNLLQISSQSLRRPCRSRSPVT